MSEIASAATTTIVLADVVMNDPMGKANVLGAGVAVLGYVPQSGNTTRFSLMVMIHVPSKFLPAEFPVEVSLVNADGTLFELPEPGGTMRPLRVAQMVQLAAPDMSNPAPTRDHIGSRASMVFEFSAGLPLKLGGLYTWRVQLDGDSDREWTYPFAVVAAPQVPVIG